MQEIITFDNVKNASDGQCVNVKITEYLGRGKFAPRDSFWGCARRTNTADNMILTTIWDEPVPDVYDMYEITTSSESVDYVVMCNIRNRLHIFKQMAENSDYNISAQKAIADIVSHWEYQEKHEGSFQSTVRAIIDYKYALMTAIDQPGFPYYLKYPLLYWSSEPQTRATFADKRLREILSLEKQHRMLEILNYRPPDE